MLQRVSEDGGATLVSLAVFHKKMPVNNVLNVKFIFHYTINKNIIFVRKSPLLLLYFFLEIQWKCKTISSVIKQTEKDDIFKAFYVYEPDKEIRQTCTPIRYKFQYIKSTEWD